MLDSNGDPQSHKSGHKFGASPQKILLPKSVNIWARFQTASQLDQVVKLSEIVPKYLRFLAAMKQYDRQTYNETI